MREVGIGLLGFGTVGGGVVAGLRRNADLLARRLGARPVIRRIADLDLERDRGVPVDRGLLTRDAAAVVRDPATEIVVELIGGTGAAWELVRMALEQGKPVVTANKALLAERGAELFALAARTGTGVHFEASVGGGIPIVRALRDGLVGDRVDGIVGILNGTCNYILTRMEAEHMSFDQALAEARREGYAEADPSLDIDGVDTAHKAVILASLAYGGCVPMQAVRVAGIRGLDRTDIEYGADLGYRVKLLAVIRRAGEEAEIGVHPALVPTDHVLASVSGVFNAVSVDSDMAGRTLYYGRGAGREPTASAVIGDIADVVREVTAGGPARPAAIGGGAAIRVKAAGEIVARYYMRLSLLDKPGVFGRIATVLGRHEISIASVLQKEVRVGEYVPVVAVTHAARERQFDAALREIDGLDIVGAPTVRIRIEE
ncbi:MAG: homoserine dehydrogenase [Lentisphaerae bacterium]|nr:homoserine dehydrogenase [Lentisphaerota bacterium]